MTAAVNASWNTLGSQQTRIQTQVILTLKCELSQLPHGAQWRLGNTTGKGIALKSFSREYRAWGVGVGGGVELRVPTLVSPLICWVS